MERSPKNFQKINLPKKGKISPKEKDLLKINCLEKRKEKDLQERKKFSQKKKK